MAQFVGLDVSQKITAVCIVDEARTRLWRGQCLSTPEQIEATLCQHAGKDVRLGIETGPMTTWLVHELRSRGLDVVCLDARHARAALKMQLNKTDANDAEGLAQIMRTGWFRSVHVKSFETHRARALLGPFRRSPPDHSAGGLESRSRHHKATFAVRSPPHLPQFVHLKSSK